MLSHSTTIGSTRSSHPDTVGFRTMLLGELLYVGAREDGNSPFTPRFGLLPISFIRFDSNTVALGRASEVAPPVKSTQLHNTTLLSV